MKQIVKFILVAVLTVGLTGIAGFAKAEPHDKLLPLLINIDGWKGDTGKGMSLAGSTLKMIKAHRSYTKAKKKIDVDLMINSGPHPASHVKEYSTDISGKRINTKKVDDFWVHTTFHTQRGIGQISVALANNQNTHSVLLLTFNKMNEEEALALAKKFKWKALKKATEKML